MRKKVVVVAFALFFVFSLWNSAFAQDYVADVLQELQATSVYVDPSIDEAVNKRSRLGKILLETDRIVLIMLPGDAVAGTDINTVVSLISSGLGDQYIIGLAVGEDLIAYGPILPSGVVADQMKRAESVSNDSVTALITFAQNIHIWQGKNPMPTPVPTPSPTKAISEQSGGGKNLSWIWLLILVPIAVVVLTFVLKVQRGSDSDSEKVRFKSPRQVRDLLQKIYELRIYVEDSELKSTLKQMCLDVEEYFKSASSDKDKDTKHFYERLTDVIEVLEKYLDIQESKRYYRRPEEEMNQGKVSIRDFSHYVLDAVRDGREAELVDYKVNRQILEAQRYR